MTTDYEGMSLDDLLAISRSDAEHAGDMAEQARVLREMSGLLQDKVDLMRDAMTTLFGDDPGSEEPAADADAAWQGSSSSMMKTELDRLYTMASSAPDVLRDNATAMDNFSTQAHQTLIRVDQLHVKAADKAHVAGSSDADTAAARDVVREANSGYLLEAEAMRETPFYPGLRETAPEENGGEWTDRHGVQPTSEPTPVTPRTPAGPAGTVQPYGASDPAIPDGTTDPGGTDPWQPPADHGPQLQNPGTVPPPAPTAPAPVAPVAPVPPVAGPPVGPVPVSPFPISPRPVTPPVISRPPVPAPTRPLPPVSGRPPVPPPTRPAPVLRPTPRPTVPPVIGGRPTPTVVPPTGRPVPNPGGPVRPVIGGRPPVTAPAPTRPVPNPGGTVRPVIGGRPVVGPYVPRPGSVGGPAGGRTGGGVPQRPTTGPMATRPTGNPTGLVRPVIGGRGTATGTTGRGTVSRTGSTVPAGSRPATSARTAPVRTMVARPTLPEYTDGMAPAPRPTSGALAADPRAVSARGARIATPATEPEPINRAPKPEPAAKPAATRPPGQRVKRIVRGGRATAERAVIRGVRRQPTTQRPGQEVFAKFAARKAAAESPGAGRPEPVTDSDELWRLARSTVRPVITGRSKRPA